MRPFRFLLFLLLLAPALFALDVPPSPTQWYTDKAGLLSPTEAAALNSKLQAFEQRSGAQFIIYVVPSIENGAIEDWTIRAVTKWKVGQAKYDNGLVLFVFVKERKMRFEVGYGLEGTVTDAITSRIRDEVIAPRFKEDDYAGGLNAGADAVMQYISKGEAPVEPLRGPRVPGRSSQPQAATPQIPGWVFLLLFIFIFFVLPKLFGGGRRRRGGGCGGPGCMPLFFFPGGGGGITFGGGGGGFGGGFGGGGGGFSGGGGGFGGGGSTGGW